MVYIEIAAGCLWGVLARSRVYLAITCRRGDLAVYLIANGVIATYSQRELFVRETERISSIYRSIGSPDIETVIIRIFSVVVLFSVSIGTQFVGIYS